MTADKGGRPPIIETPEDFDQRASAYFAQCETDARRPTVNGLCLALGFCSRQTLHNYEAKPEFLDVVKRSRMVLEAAWEDALAAQNVAGAIFWLKNQGWKDTQDINHGGAVTINKVMLVGGSGDGQG